MSKKVVLTARYVVCMDDNGSVYSPGYVEIENTLIKSVGSIEKIPEGERIDYGNAAIIPGLLNCHNHAAMTLLRGIVDDIPLDEWLNDYIWPLEARFLSPGFIRVGTMLAATEMLKGGTTFFADMYFFADEVAAAARQAGIRALIGEGLLDFPTPSAKDSNQTFDYIRNQSERYCDDELIRVHIAAHSTYATGEDQLRRCAELASELGLPIEIHCGETEKEAKDCLAEHGKSQVAYLADLGLLDTRIGLVHMAWPNESDWKLLGRDNVTVIPCPQSNLKLGSGVPPIARYLEKGIRVSLGTDGAASNNNLDMWEEMRLASLLAKVARLDPTVLPAERALRMVTIDAACTWGLGGELGSLEPAKKADIVIVALDKPHLIPTYDIYSTLVYAAGAADVRDVFVAGRQVLKDRRLTTLDESAIIAEAVEWSRKIKTP